MKGQSKSFPAGGAFDLGSEGCLGVHWAEKGIAGSGNTTRDVGEEVCIQRGSVV